MATIPQWVEAFVDIATGNYTLDVMEERGGLVLWAARVTSGTVELEYDEDLREHFLCLAMTDLGHKPLTLRYINIGDRRIEVSP